MGIPLNIVKIVLRCFVVFALCRTSTTTDEKPAIFIFGDSLLDNGNNNYIFTLARANFQPYGIDFGGPTGRFTNGRTTADVLGKIFLFLFFTFYFTFSDLAYMLFRFNLLMNFIMYHQIKNLVLVLLHLTWLPLQVNQWF